MNKQQSFNKICRDIKSIKIQGAANIAKKAFFAYKLIPTKASKKKLLDLRPTEPMLSNILKIANKLSYKSLLKKLDENQKKINQNISSLIKNKSIIFTHCHSSTIIKALIYSHKKGRKFEVFNTETRPLFQGRKTSEELRKAGIKTTMFVDSGAEQAIKNSGLVLLGADAITKKGVINKIGSGMFAEIAKIHNIPMFIVSDSLKYSPIVIKIEQRSKKEVWNTKNKKIKIQNPAFEFIEKDKITRIISELGILKYNDFLKKVRKS